jgi:hypothetical protein
MHHAIKPEDQKQTTLASGRELTDNELESIIGATVIQYGAPPSEVAVLYGPGMQTYRPTKINGKLISANR